MSLSFALVFMPQGHDSNSSPLLNFSPPSISIEDMAKSLEIQAFYLVSLSNLFHFFNLPLLANLHVCCVFQVQQRWEASILVWKCETLQREGPTLPPFGLLRPPDRESVHISSSVDFQRVAAVGHGTKVYFQHQRGSERCKAKQSPLCLLPLSLWIALKVGLLLSFSSR